MSIYRLYIQNNNHAGFWIQHRSWQNKCAQVQTIAGQSKGGLPGSSPTHDGAQVLVLCFDVRSGRPVGAIAAADRPEDRGYVMIAQPPWYTKPLCQEANAEG